PAKAGGWILRIWGLSKTAACESSLFRKLCFLVGDLALAEAINLWQYECMHSRMQENRAMSQATLETGPRGGRTGQPPSRVGKKGVTFYLDPDAMKQLRGIGVEEDVTLQGLMIEAANMLFKSRGKAEIAK
ncbi:ribbon-helix-helix domain-containing protein, partial [Acidiphilium sp.]|uniref:ribbon-helix-helix domain-containing protein n=1 Tax=Acidiphilium sp. TaxID=527 RepID=UPI003CFFB5BF